MNYQLTKTYTINYIDKTGHKCCTSVHAENIRFAIEAFNLTDFSDDCKEITNITFDHIDPIPDYEMMQINAFLHSTKNGLDQQ